MEKMIMKNWGFFLQELEEMYEQFKQERKEERDPYKQLAIDSKMEIINNALREYKSYIKTIGADNGKKFSTYLNNNLIDKHKKARSEKEAYMVVIHQVGYSLYDKLTRRFSAFIQEQR